MGRLAVSLRSRFPRLEQRDPALGWEAAALREIDVLEDASEPVSLVLEQTVRRLEPRQGGRREDALLSVKAGGRISHAS